MTMFLPSFAEACTRWNDTMCQGAKPGSTHLPLVAQQPHEALAARAGAAHVEEIRREPKRDEVLIVVVGRGQFTSRPAPGME